MDTGDYSAAEAAFYRCGNGARSLAGASRPYLIPAHNGAMLLLVPAEYQAARREAAFAEALCSFWLLHHGEAAARACLSALLRGDRVA